MKRSRGFRLTVGWLALSVFGASSIVCQVLIADQTVTDRYLDSIRRVMPFDVQAARATVQFPKLRDKQDRSNPPFVHASKRLRDVFDPRLGRQIETGFDSIGAHRIAFMRRQTLIDQQNSEIGRGRGYGRSILGTTFLDYLNPTFKGVFFEDLIDEESSEIHIERHNGETIVRLTNPTYLEGGEASVVLDPDHGHLLRRASFKSESGQQEWILEVTQFKQVGDGLRIPAKGTVRRLVPSGPLAGQPFGGSNLTVDVANSTFGKSVHSSVFDSESLPSVSLTDFRGWVLYIEDSKSREIATKSDAIHRESRFGRAVIGTATNPWFLWLNISLLILLGGYFLWRKTRSRLNLN
jgi:hypothetical protein